MSKPIQIISGFMAVIVMAAGINMFLLPSPPTPDEISAYMNSPEYILDRAAAFRAADERARFGL